MQHVMAEFLAQMAATSLLEWLAVALALAYVWLAARENMLCWLCAFFSTAIYTWLFWQVTLPFQSLLNAYYMVMAVYGFVKWRANSAQPQSIQVWPLHRHIMLIPACVTLAWCAAHYAGQQFNNDYLLLDAMINVFSVMTTIMVAHKVLENWLYWFVINAASAFLYFNAGLLLTALLFVCYLGFSLYGFIHWRQLRQPAHAV